MRIKRQAKEGITRTGTVISSVSLAAGPRPATPFSQAPPNPIQIVLFVSCPIMNTILIISIQVALTQMNQKRFTFNVIIQVLFENEL